MRKSLRTLIVAFAAVLGVPLGAQAQSLEEPTDMSDKVSTVAVDDWTYTGTASWHINNWSTEGTWDGTGMVTPFFENWLYSGNILPDATITKTITGLAAGTYKFTALVRTLNEAGGFTPYGATLIANDGFTEASFYGTACNNGTYGTYSVTGVVGDDGQLVVGVKLDGVNFNWISFKDLKLEYQGTATDAMKASLQSAINVIPADASMSDEASSAWTTAKTSAQTVYDNEEATAAEITAAIQSLKEPGYAALKSIYETAYTSYVMGQAASVLSQMKALTESTNFYTEAALKEYYTQWQEKYDNGTLTVAEAGNLKDPYAYLGWHSAKTYDEFLMSTFEVTSDDWNQYCINTWSDEENALEDGFKVPFFEYWVSDANTLSAKTISATVTGLPEGTYTVDAWVRVRLANNQTDAPTGITMQVNDGDAVDVCTGTVVTGQSQLYRDHFTATGVVGEDGNLTLKFIVVDGNNINWLSFKDLNYAAQGSVTVTEKGKYADEQYYATYVTETAVDLDKCDFTAYAISIGSDVEYTALSGVIPAGTPLVVMAKAAGTYDAVAGSGKATSVTTSLQASDGTATSDGATYYVLANKDNGLGWYLLSQDETVPAGKCYFIYESSNGAKYIGLDNATTGISAVSNSTKNAARYNVSGQRVDKSYKGIVIENGKKYLVK